MEIPFLNEIFKFFIVVPRSDGKFDVKCPTCNTSQAWPEGRPDVVIGSLAAFAGLHEKCNNKLPKE